MTMRRSLLFTLLFGGLMLWSLGGCSGGNPNVGAAEDALEAQNYDQALSSINTAIDQDSANADAYMLKARILRQQADSTMPPDQYKEFFEKARMAETKAAEVNPEVRSDMQNSMRMAYIQQMQRGVDAFNRGQQSGDSLTFVRAASFFGSAAVTMPDSADAFLNEAYARLNAGEREEAIAPLETYVEKSDSVGTNAYTILGQLYLTNDRAEDALDMLEDGAEQYPDNEEIQSLLLNAYNQAGATDRAMEAYREQIERNPNNATYRYNYGSLLLNEERYADAIDQLAKAAELEPSNVKAQYNLGAAHVNQAVALDDSIAAIEDAARSDDRDLTEEEDQQIEELVEMRQGNFRSAVVPLEKARQLASSGSEYRRDICRALFTAYVQTEQQDQAEEIEQCAGYDEGRAEEATDDGN